MISTTPVPERYTRFSCPHPACAGCNRPSEGNLGPRSWTGTHRPSEGRRCTACDRACSEREGTWRARSTRPEATVHQLLPCQRWGLCEAGTAASCAVALKTVQRWQSVAAHRAQTQQQQVVPQGDVSGVPWDEAQAKLRPRRVAWSQTALAMGRGGLLGGDGGPRPPDTAATLLAQVVARAQALPRWLPDGWKASPAALRQVVGGVHRPPRRGHVGRKPTPRRGAPTNLCSAQVVQGRDTAGHVVAVKRRVVYGGPRVGKQWRLRQRGAPRQTACMERWSGPLRGLLAPRRRRPRGQAWSRSRHRGKVGRMVSLSSVVMPHKRLRQGRLARTPAMAIGLTDPVWLIEWEV
jgi:hypothetical protein